MVTDGQTHSITDIARLSYFVAAIGCCKNAFSVLDELSTANFEIDKL